MGLCPLSEKQNFLIIHLQVCRPFLLDHPDHRPVNSLPTSCKQPSTLLLSAAVVFVAVSPHFHDLASALPLPSSFPTLQSSCGIVTESDFFPSWHLHRRKAIHPHYPGPNMADSFPVTLGTASVNGVCCKPTVAFHTVTGLWHTVLQGENTEHQCPGDCCAPGPLAMAAQHWCLFSACTVFCCFSSKPWKSHRCILHTF